MRDSMDATQLFALALILLCMGLSLLGQAHHAGANGQVWLHMGRAEWYPISVHTAVTAGSVLTLIGAAFARYALRSGVRFWGTSGPLVSWPLVVGVFAFLAIMLGFWNFLLHAMQ